MILLALADHQGHLVPLFQLGILLGGIGDDIALFRGGGILLLCDHFEFHILLQLLQCPFQFPASDIDHLQFLCAATNGNGDGGLTILDLFVGLRSLLTDLVLLILLVEHRLAHLNGEIAQDGGVLFQLLQGIAQQVGHGVLLGRSKDGTSDEIKEEDHNTHHKDEDSRHGHRNGRKLDTASEQLDALGPLSLLVIVLVILIVQCSSVVGDRLLLLRLPGTGNGDHPSGFLDVVDTDGVRGNGIGIFLKLRHRIQHILSGSIALVGIGGHGLHGDGLQTHGDIRIQFPGLNGNGVDVLNGNEHRGLALKGQPPGEHLIEHDTHRVQVRPPVDVAALGLLRGDVMHRPNGLLGQGGLRGRQAGNAKVSHLNAAVPQHQNVVGLDVPVDDAPAVGVVQRPQHLGDKVQGLLPLQGSAALLHILLQGHAVNELHDDVVEPIALAHVIDTHNIDMGQHGNRLRLRLETAAELCVAGQLRLEDLDGHQPIESMAAGLIHHGHATHANTL